jgi:hypothetical protein
MEFAQLWRCAFVTLLGIGIAKLKIEIAQEPESLPAEEDRVG